MIYAVIMAGGSGTRLWPRSRDAHPKHLIALAGTETLLQHTVRRLVPGIPPDRIVVVGATGHEAETRRQLSDFPGVRIAGEPMVRDTAACIGFAATLVQRADPEAVMAALPADHFLDPADKFVAALMQAEQVAREHHALVTFGIKPSFACTQYGYIERGEPLSVGGKGTAPFSAYRVASFREKPDKATAEEFVRQGRFYWNSGTFVWRVQDILDAIKEAMPSLYAGLLHIRASLGTADEAAVCAEEYGRFARISIDYGVMEKSKNTAVLEWSHGDYDLGSWEAVTHFQEADAQGNTLLGTGCLVNSENCIVVSEGDHLVGGVGVRDLVIVHSPDATLVCRRDQLNEVKELVRRIREKGLGKYL
jgi:mannose-1-phosphate guanylyltransferase